jgi:hypothetical protein
MGRDRGLNPLESGFSHELPDNDTAWAFRAFGPGA